MTVTQIDVGANTAAPLPDYAAILGECCYCCIGMLYDDKVRQDAMIEYIASAWSCLKPQCFGHGYTYNSGTLGQILASDTNSAEVCRLAHLRRRSEPGLAQGGGLHHAVLLLDRGQSGDVDPGPELRRTVLRQAPGNLVSNASRSTSSSFCRRPGFVVTVPLTGGTGHLTSPMIVNDTTNNRYDDNGRLNATWWNTNSRRLAAATADSAAIALNQVIGLALFTKNTQIPKGIRGTNPKLILGAFRTWAKSQIGILFSEFDNIDQDIQLKTDFEVAPKCQGLPGKLWLDFVYRPPVRISNIIVNAKPAMLSNC